MRPRPTTRNRTVLARRRGLRIRELGAGEVATLQTVFAGLSPTSRFTRYLAPVHELTPGMVRALTAVDGHDHVALAVERVRGPWRWEPIGLARVVRTGGDRGEIAVEVVDDAQGRGIGTWLLTELGRVASTRGFREVEGDVLADNEAMRRVFRRVLPDARATDRGPTLHYVAALPGGWPTRAGPLTLDLSVEDLLLDLNRRPAAS